MSDMHDTRSIAGWFAGPKGENAEWFSRVIARVVDDYYAWRRNYFPEDGVTVDSALRRANEPFRDAFEDRLIELLARLKGDFPFQSPRYAAHMLSEQSLPAIAGYFAAMLYNPNNVSSEAAPVTVRLELEAASLLAAMVGYGPGHWSHLTSGGTVANIEALWVARSVKYLPLLVREVRGALGLGDGGMSADPRVLLGMSPRNALEAYASLAAEATARYAHEAGTRLARAVGEATHNVGERGLASLCAAIGSDPVLLVPESHHYCFEKAMDVLGMGRRSLVCVGVDETFRMRVDDLTTCLDAVDAQGRHVLAVVAVVGSTEEGAVDPVDQIVALREERERSGKASFWLHADGAYGGYLRTVTIPARCGLGSPVSRVRVGGVEREIPLRLPEHAECSALERLGECDSVTIDPHKLGYVPYPAGAICFRSNLVKPLVRQVAPYLEEAPEDLDAERTSDRVGVYILEGSKPGAAAAAVWLSHSLIPLDTHGHGRLIRETIRNACELHSLLERLPTMMDGLSTRCVPLCSPGSNIVCFAFRPEKLGTDLASINKANRAIYERFSMDPGERVYDQSFFVSRTTLSARQYAPATVKGFLSRLGVSSEEYEREGIFLLRSVLMNPWYDQAKQRGRYFLSELAESLYAAAGEAFAPLR